MVLLRDSRNSRNLAGFFERLVNEGVAPEV